MVAAETTLHHPYLRLPLFLGALEKHVHTKHRDAEGSLVFNESFFPALLSVPDVQVLLRAALPGRACDAGGLFYMNLWPPQGHDCDEVSLA